MSLLAQLGSDLGITSLERSGATILVGFVRPQDGQPFMLRLRCEGWPIQPPSVDFVNSTTRLDEGPTVWPSDGEQAFKTTSQPRFVCLPGTREYHNAHGAATGELLKPAVLVHQILMKVRGA
jgi:hypothetical protein